MAILSPGALSRRGVPLRNRSSKLGKFPLIALAALTACGGAEASRLAIREDSTPAVARAELREALRLDDGTARAAFAFPFREGRRLLDGLLAEQAGDTAAASAAWRELADARFPAVAGAAQRHLLER